MRSYLQDKELYIWALVYLVITAVLHFRLKLDIGMIWYALGAGIGLHLLPALERALKTEPSPLRTLLAQIVLLPLTFFVLSSSSFILGKGVVLFLNLVFVYLQQKEFKATGTLSTWLRQLRIMPEKPRQQQYLYAVAGIFMVETALFILV